MPSKDSSDPPCGPTKQDERAYVRMDVEILETKADDATRIVWFTIVPNRRRYLSGICEGKRVWIDRYFGDKITEEQWAEVLQGLSGMPLSQIPRHIDDAVGYAQSRRLALETELDTGKHIPPTERLEQHSELAATPRVRSMTFLSVDICGSTALREKDGDTFDQCFRIFFREMVTVAAEFHGRLLKSTGDGLIVYIDTSAINEPMRRCGRHGLDDASRAE